MEPQFFLHAAVVDHEPSDVRRVLSAFLAGFLQDGTTGKRSRALCAGDGARHDGSGLDGSLLASPFFHFSSYEFFRLLSHIYAGNVLFQRPLEP